MVAATAMSHFLGFAELAHLDAARVVPQLEAPGKLLEPVPYGARPRKRGMRARARHSLSSALLPGADAVLGLVAGVLFAPLLLLEELAAPSPVRSYAGRRRSTCLWSP